MAQMDSICTHRAQPAWHQGQSTPRLLWHCWTMDGLANVSQTLAATCSIEDQQLNPKGNGIVRCSNAKATTVAAARDLLGRR